MVHVMVFGSYKVESKMAILYAIPRPFGGEHTASSCMLASVAKVSLKTHRKVVSEEGDGKMGDERES